MNGATTQEVSTLALLTYIHSLNTLMKGILITSTYFLRAVVRKDKETHINLVFDQLYGLIRGLEEFVGREGFAELLGLYPDTYLDYYQKIRQGLSCQKAA